MQSIINAEINNIKLVWKYTEISILVELTIMLYIISYSDMCLYRENPAL